MRGLPLYQPSDIQECIRLTLELARRTNPEVECTGISLNTSAFPREKGLSLCQDLGAATGYLCFDPAWDDLTPVVENL